MVDRDGMPPLAASLAEAAGTAILLAVGLSAVTLDFSTSSPVRDWLGEPAVRRLVTGLVFAGTATAVVYSPLGRRSGGPLNPAMTLGFLRLGKLRWQGALAYVGCQVAGALAGAALVLAALVFSQSRGEIACGKLVHTGDYPCHFRNCAYRRAEELAMLDTGERPA